MSHSDRSTLLTRGRKAGLSTRELYAALAARPPEGHEGQDVASDENGYVAHLDEQGHCIFQPLHDSLTPSSGR